MKEIKTNGAQCIRRIFDNKYYIPDFQRPYCWDERQCEELWDDLIRFFDSNPSDEDQYFIGSLYLYNRKSCDDLSVVDGQQRLVTLQLLINAFLTKENVISPSLVNELKYCIKSANEIEPQQNLRIALNKKQSEDLANILFSIKNEDNDEEDNNLMNDNHSLFEQKIKDFYGNNSPETLERLIHCLLNKVVFLPIYCCSEQDALDLFISINSKGIELDDVEIFKAKLYFAAENENKKNTFIEKWNYIEEKRDITDLFNILRYLIHATSHKKSGLSEDMSLRKFFTNKKVDILTKNWNLIINKLYTIDCIYSTKPSKNRDYDIACLWFILKCLPSTNWKYPLFVFLDKYGSINDDVYTLPSEHKDAFKRLLEHTLSYFIIKGVIGSRRKESILQICRDIVKEDNYLNSYRSYIECSEEDFLEHLQQKDYRKYRDCLVLLCSYLNPKQDKKDFFQLICPKQNRKEYQIEHILPKENQRYYGWDITQKEEWTDSLGNLIPLESKINITIQNKFFDYKRKAYNQSKVQDAQEVRRKHEWIANRCKEAQKNKEERLKLFLRDFLQRKSN